MMADIAPASRPQPPSADTAARPLPSDPPLASRGVTLLLAAYVKNGVQESIDSLTRALETRDSALPFLADLFPDIFHGTADQGFEFCPRGGDVVFTVAVRFAAGLTGEATVSLKPSQRYREMLTALASHVEWHVVEVHDWPVLSVDPPNSTVSEAAGESIPGGGAAAGGTAA